MALVTGQASVSTVSTILFYVPAGPSVVTINSGTVSASTAYIAMGDKAAATTANSYILDPGRGLTFATYQKSGLGTVNAIAATSAVVSWLISKP